MYGYGPFHRMDKVYSIEEYLPKCENKYDSDSEIIYKIDNDSDINKKLLYGYCIIDESA